MKKEDKKPYILTAVSIILIAIITIYIYLNTSSIEFEWGKFTWYTFQALIITSALGFLIYNLLNSNINKDMERPKEKVNTNRTTDIVSQQIAKYNEIPCNRKGFFKKREEVELINQKDVYFKNIITYTDPSNNTSDEFCKMEIVLKRGKRTGMVTLEVRIDRGEEYIWDNWNENINWHDAINLSVRDLRNYPLTSPQNSMERLLEKRLDLIDEGFSEHEVDKLVNPIINLQTSKPSNQEPIKIPKAQDYKKSKEESSSDDEVNDLEMDIQQFREMNK